MHIKVVKTFPSGKKGSTCLNLQCCRNRPRMFTHHFLHERLLFSCICFVWGYNDKFIDFGKRAWNFNNPVWVERKRIREKRLRKENAKFYAQNGIKALARLLSYSQHLTPNVGGKIPCGPIEHHAHNLDIGKVEGKWKREDKSSIQQRIVLRLRNTSKHTPHTKLGCHY